MSADVVELHAKKGDRVRFLSAAAPHARVYADWKHLDSFKTLTMLQRCVLVDVLLAFSKFEGNEVRLTASAISKQYNVGHPKAKTAILSLEERGWIERIGLSPGPTGQAGGRYRILCLSPNGQPVTGPYQTWRAR